MQKPLRVSHHAPCPRGGKHIHLYHVVILQAPLPLFALPQNSHASTSTGILKIPRTCLHLIGNFTPHRPQFRVKSIRIHHRTPHPKTLSQIQHRNQHQIQSSSPPILIQHPVRNDLSHGLMKLYRTRGQSCFPLPNLMSLQRLTLSSTAIKTTTPSE